MRLRVIVPATTANLGPGFDALGLALDLVNEVEAEVLEGDGPHEFTIEGEGAGQLPTDERHLMLQAAQWYCGGRQTRLPRLRLRQLNRIPLARGLGSSAAAIVAGLCLAGYLRGGTCDELVAAATRLEGHPDNVAPALLGGLVASVAEDTVHAAPCPIHERLAVAVAIPAFELSTHQARQALPSLVPYKDAVYNLSRVALLLAGLREGRRAWVEAGTKDCLHQPYRCPLVPGLDKVMDAAHDAGAWGAFLSGAGPTMAAWVDREAAPEAVSRAMVEAFRASGVESRGLVLRVRLEGAACAQA